MPSDTLGQGRLHELPEGSLKTIYFAIAFLVNITICRKSNATDGGHTPRLSTEGHLQMKGFLEDEARAGGFCAKYRDPCPSSSSWAGAVLPWWLAAEDSCWEV